MAQVPSNLIPSQLTQLPIAPVASEDSLLYIVYAGVSYQIRAGDLLQVAGVPISRQVIAGTGLAGGGALATDVTLSVAPKAINSALLSNTGVTPGTYGSASAIPVLTVDSTGRVTAAGSVPFSVSGFVPVTRQIIAGAGLTGGGALNANVTLGADFSNSTPLALNTLGSAGVATKLSRADHRHPAVDLSSDTQVQNVLGLANGGTARSLVMQPGAVIWSGADGLYVSAVGTAGKILISGGSGAPVWGDNIPGNAATATLAASATNLAGGGANRVVYQTATGVTGFLSAPTVADTYLRWDGSDYVWQTIPGSGTVTSVALSAPTGFTVSGSPVTSNGTLALGFAAGYSLPTDTQQSNWDTAYNERLEWDGGSTNLVAATGRTSLGATTLGGNLFTLANPSAITFPRFNADNTVSALNAADFRAAIGAGTGDGTVTSVTGTSPVASTGGTTPAISLASGYGDTQNPYGSKTANYFLAAPDGVPGAPTFRAVVAADIPTLNQNTTGNAATATNVASGAANQLVYQTGASTTGFVNAPTVANTYLEWSGSAFQWSTNPLGTVTSVGLALPSEFIISGSPVTTSGTLTGTWANQTANYVFAGPATGSPATPAFRALVDADIPAALTGKTYNGLTLTSLTTGWKISGGTTPVEVTFAGGSAYTLSGSNSTVITLPSTTGTVALNNQQFYIGTTQVAINRASASLALTGVSIDGSAGSVVNSVTFDSSGTGGASPQTFNGSAAVTISRNTLGAAASGANADITSMTGVTGGVSSPDYVQFDATATVTDATAKLYYDKNDQYTTLSFQMNGSTVQKVGEEQYYRVKCSSAVTKGQVVMFTGTLGASGGLTAAPATGLTATQADYILGVAVESGSTNDWIFVTSFGEVKGIDTTGGAESWVQGQVLYYNPAVTGGLTKTKPITPNAIAVMAAVVNVSSSNGILFVRPTFGSVLGGTDGNVEFTSLTGGDVIVYDAADSRWENRAQSTLAVGSATTATNVAGGAANQLVYQTGAGTSGFVTAPTVANTYLEWSGSVFQWSTNPLGTVTSVALSAPTGFSVSGSPVTTNGTLALAFSAGYSLPTTASQSNWDTAYSERLQWDGGSTNLVAATGRTSLGGTTVGQNFFTLTNPSAVTFPRINADNTVSALSASDFRTAIGAGTGSGTVTSVALALPAEFTVSGSPVTTSGTLTGAWATQTANYFFAGPTTGSAATPTFRAIVAGDVPTLNQNTTGQAGSVANAVTFTNTGGAAPGTTYNGSVARTVDYSTVGAPKTDGTGASGTWSISINGNAATATTATTATNANNFAVTDDTSTNATMYPVWVTANTGNLPARVTSSKLSFNPSTGALTVTGGIGGGTF